MSNPAADLLVALKVIDPASVTLYSNQVRDRSDVQAMRCSRSGVIFLSDARAAPDYYETKIDIDVTKANGATMTPPGADDDARRAGLYASVVAGKRWLEVGAGHGGLLDRLGPVAAAAVGVEPNAGQRAAAAARGWEMTASVDDLGERTFDVITLFHVLEHLSDPAAMLASARERLAEGGLLIVEAPHARDVLLETFASDAFRNFTLWSEHLVLHTRNSLEVMLRASGFNQISIVGHQRYSLANHLYWLRHGAPGGHAFWGFLESPELKSAYEARLAALDQTDTLTAFVRR